MSKNRLDYRAQLARHSHDISGGYSSTLTTGPIVPQYYHILGPGDSVYFDVHMFARLQDIITAFLGEVDVHLDAFFVPLQMLYTPFGQIYSQTDDYISSNFTVSSSSNFPSDLFPTLDITQGMLAHGATYQRTTYVPTECWGKEIFRLFDSLGVNPLAVCSEAMRTKTGYQGAYIPDDFCHNPVISPWLFAAYQAIYQKFYRNDSIERLSVGSYNFDKDFINGTISNAANYVALRYAQRPQDYFTKIRVSPIASAVNSIYATSGWDNDGGSLDNRLSKINSFLTSEGFSARSQSFANVTGTTSSKSFSSIGSYSSAGELDSQDSNALNTGNIRALFAVDKFMRIYGRADKTYDDQILAHFGIKIPHDVKHDATRIKGWRFSIGSQPVYGSSNVPASEGSGDSDLVSALGQVGGQAQSVFNSQQEKFSAPVHGVFMIVAYAVTKPRYVNTFDKLNLLTDRLSFPIPEYDKLGAQPLYKFETTPYFLKDNDSRSQFCGWQNRYSQFKEKWNRVSYTFAQQDIEYDRQAVNVYAPWMLSRGVFSEIGNAISVLGPENHFPSYECFRESVNALNIVMRRFYTNGFAETYFENPHMILQSDPIITEFMCNCKLVSWMSETGEPDL